MIGSYGARTAPDLFLRRWCDAEFAFFFFSIMILFYSELLNMIAGDEQVDRSATCQRQLLYGANYEFPFLFFFWLFTLCCSISAESRFRFVAHNQIGSAVGGTAGAFYGFNHGMFLCFFCYSVCNNSVWPRCLSGAQVSTFI